jgi:AcrR family transcriptional regulator
VTEQGNPELDRPWRLPRGRHGLPRETVTRSQRERLIAGAVRATAAKGYEATSVADILAAAGVGRATFYELFEDKEQCFLAAHDVLIDDLFARTSEAYQRPGAWPERVRNGLAAMLDWFASDTDIARVTLIEVVNIGPALRDRFVQVLARFIALLDAGREPSESAHSLTNVSTIAGGAFLARIYEEVVGGRTTELPRLLPDLTYEVLLPFLGPEGASEESERARGALSGLTQPKSSG